MNHTELFFAIGELDAEFLEKAEAERKKYRVRRLGKRWALPVAACLCCAILLGVFPPIKASAEFTIEDGILLSYNGSKENVVIPQSVTSVADYAFSQTPQLTTVTLTENIRSIGACAFYGCTGLADIIISEGNPNFIRENDTVMSSDRRLIVKYFGTDEIYTVPESVLFIAAEAFSGNSVKSVVLHQAIRFLGKDCFSGLSNPPGFGEGEFSRYLNDGFQHSLYLLQATDIGDLYGGTHDSTSVFDGVVTAYGFDVRSASALIYRFGGKGEYYQVLSFRPELTGIPDESDPKGSFRSMFDGVIAIDSGVKIRYDSNSQPYIVASDDLFYDGYMKVTDLYITHDGGLTWNRLPDHPPVHLYGTCCASFADEKTGIVGQSLHGTITPVGWITLDGGNSWQSIRIGIPDRFACDNGESQFVSIMKKNGDYILEVELHDDQSVHLLSYCSGDGINWIFLQA